MLWRRIVREKAEGLAKEAAVSQSSGLWSRLITACSTSPHLDSLFSGLFCISLSLIYSPKSGCKTSPSQTLFLLSSARSDGGPERFLPAIQPSFFSRIYSSVFEDCHKHNHKPENFTTANTALVTNRTEQHIVAVWCPEWKHVRGAPCHTQQNL